MFTLAITHPHRSSVTTHVSREVALGELDRFLEATRHRLRVVTADWTPGALTDRADLKQRLAPEPEQLSLF